MKVLVDTCVIIDHLRGTQAATDFLGQIEEGHVEGLVSAVTVMELFAGKSMDEEEENELRSLLGIFRLIPVDSGVAERAGRLLAQFRRSHGLNPVDALIAATALVNDAALASANERHFRIIPGLLVTNPLAAADEPHQTLHQTDH
ncbi:MAG TPA: type II toxin-antitoxin system VapC family toxin [Firmicutes bacterium]|nr:type II toxin-antitoxin system VapC family toxin [Bacillota bacterium]